MARYRSIRSSSRARTSESGYALAMAVILAILYFGMIELLMIDSSRALVEARQFRSRIIALTLAENGAELAAARMVEPGHTFATPAAEDDQGKISGKLMKTAAGVFDIQAEGVTSGLDRARASVHLRGRVVGNNIKLDYVVHSK